MDDPPDLGSPISINRYGVFYEFGKHYPLSRKWEVAVEFFRLWEYNWPNKPSIASLAKNVHVSWYYANKVINELTVTGHLANPTVIFSRKRCS
jgi:hypothetical protein